MYFKGGREMNKERLLIMRMRNRWKEGMTVLKWNELKLNNKESMKKGVFQAL